MIFYAQCCVYPNTNMSVDDKTFSIKFTKNPNRASKAWEKANLWNGDNKFKKNLFPISRSWQYWKVGRIIWKTTTPAPQIIGSLLMRIFCEVFTLWFHLCKHFKLIKEQPFFWIFKRRRNQRNYENLICIEMRAYDLYIPERLN